MSSKKILRLFAVAMMIGILLIPPQPSQAQFGGIVFDPKMYALKIKEGVQKAKEWTDTIKHYQEMYKFATQNLTNLRGILKTVDKQLYDDWQMALLASDISSIIRDTRKLKRDWEGMVKYQVKSLKEIDDRLNNGIFDWEKDKQAIETYLLVTMGRDSKQTVDEIYRFLRADQQLMTWWMDREFLGIEIAAEAKSIERNYENLGKESSKTAEQQRNIEHLNKTIQFQEQYIADLKSEHKKLTEKINQRLKDYGLRFEDMANFAKQIDNTNDMFIDWSVAKKTIERQMEDMGMSAGPRSTQ